MKPDAIYLVAAKAMGCRLRAGDVFLMLCCGCVSGRTALVSDKQYSPYKSVRATGPMCTSMISVLMTVLVNGSIIASPCDKNVV